MSGNLDQSTCPLPLQSTTVCSLYRFSHEDDNYPLLSLTPLVRMEAVLTSSQEKEVNNNERVKEGETAACDLAVSPRTVTVTDPEEWICVAKLPPDTDHQAFLHLLSDFGSVKDSFLQKSTKTGESFSPSVVQLCLLADLVSSTTQYSTVSFSSLPPSCSIVCQRAEERTVRAHMLVTLILLAPSAPQATARLIPTEKLREFLFNFSITVHSMKFFRFDGLM